MSVFTREYLVAFGDSDPAGILFYARIHDYYHKAYEEWVVESIGPWKDWFQSEVFAVPIRAAKVDYLAPIFSGEKLKIEISMDEASINSFQLKAVFFQGQTNCAEMHVRHVFIDRKTGQKSDIPNSVKQKIFR